MAFLLVCLLCSIVAAEQMPVGFQNARIFGTQADHNSFRPGEIVGYGLLTRRVA